MFYLTIDDAPNEFTKQKLEFLNSNNIKAIWFCIGHNIEKHPDLLVECINSGHIIANHTFSHPHFSEINFQEQEEQISKTEKLIDRLYAETEFQRPVKWFRFPYGDTGKYLGNLASYLKDQGFKPGVHQNVQLAGKWEITSGQPYWGWSYDIREWAINRGGQSGVTLEQIKEDLNEYLNTYEKTKDQIILIHDHEETTSEFYELINQILSSGVEFTLNY